MTFHCNRKALSVLAMGIGFLATQCSEGSPPTAVSSTTQRLTVRAECAADAGTDAAATWSCGEERVVECRERQESDAVEVLHVDVQGCDTSNLSVDPGPYGVGSHDIAVFANGGTPATDAGRSDASAPVASDGGDASPPTPSTDGGAPGAICMARLTIVDTTPPDFESHDRELWPPNHKFHSFKVDDCVTVTDACDSNVDVHFTSVTVDEVDDADGSGNHAGDIRFDDCRTVSLRAERAGGGDGRIYELAWVATDAAGNSAEGVCHVAVPHDQGKGAGLAKHESGSDGGVTGERIEAPACAGETSDQ